MHCEPTVRKSHLRVVRAMNFTGIVPLRSGSQGLPGKNTRLLNGIPLYQHAIRQALRTLARCIVTTDIQEILEWDPPNGCKIVRRPAALASVSTSMAEVMSYTIRQCGLEKEHLVLLQATSPLRSDSDILEATDKFSSGNYELVMSVRQTDSCLLKAGFLAQGHFVPVSSPKYCFENRQALPPMYRPNGAVYVFSAASLIANNGFPTNSIGAIFMPAERSLDIDTADDFLEVAQYMSGKHS